VRASQPACFLFCFLLCYRPPHTGRRPALALLLFCIRRPQNAPWCTAAACRDEAYRSAYLVPRFGNEIAQDIKPLDIQRWFKSLHETGDLAWTTIAKMRGVMSRIYKVGIRQEHVAKNPVLHVETRSKTNYKAIVITPEQTLAILKSLPSPLHFTLVGLAVGGSTDTDLQALGKGRRRRNEDGSVGRLCPAAFDSRSASSRIAKTDALCEDWGFCLSIPQGGGPRSPLRIYFRRRPSAAGRKEGRSTDRGRAKVRTSQSSPLT
jgi:hypothetical protein